ncbi:hypothetical protein LX32DRAFT_491898, partial [Colletotrichum zoysiae]
DTSFVNHLSEPFEAVGRDSSTPHALTATWIISFEQIEKRSPRASELLSLMSFLDRQAIPSEFVNAYFQTNQAQDPMSDTGDAEDTEVAVTKALGTLKAFSFVTETRDQSVDMHRLVQAITKKWLFDKQRGTQFAQQALRVVFDAYPYGEYETRELCRKYLPHAYALLRSTSSSSRDNDIRRAFLLHNVSSYLAYQRNWDEAGNIVIQALELKKRVLGEEDRSTLVSMNELGSIYQKQGRWEEAEKLLESVLESKKRVVGTENPETLTGTNNLVLTYQNQARWEEAKKLQVSLLEISTRVLGESHATTLINIMSNLSYIYWEKGQLEKAEGLLVRATEM